MTYKLYCLCWKNLHKVGGCVKKVALWDYVFEKRKLKNIFGGWGAVKSGIKLVLLYVLYHLH